MSPLRASLAFLGIITAWAGSPRPVAPPEAATARPPTVPSPGATILRDLEILHLRAHAAADRLAELDVGVHPLPPPKRALAFGAVPP